MSEAARILVVDDELPVCKSVSAALASEGYAIDMALSAEEALSKEAESGYDVIITDLMMPGLSGMDLLRTLKDKAVDTKVIMITGYPSIKSAVEAVKLGAFDYIPKPFTPTELRSLVSRALESKRYRDRQKISPPPGIYTVPENSWAAVEESADVRIGIHHLFLAAIDEVTSLELPKVGEMRYQGEACARLTDSRGHVHRVWTPVTGKVMSVNEQVIDDHSKLMLDPYGSGWVLLVAATDLVSDLKNLVSVGP
jgi:CheY-like chemotaxis protein/glycine cleavage system H lipoate-binding protein